MVSVTGDRATRLAWALARWPEVWILLGPAIYLFGAIAPSLLVQTGEERAARFVFAAYRGFCHQLPHRTLHPFGEPMAVCARCAALAGGIVFGALLLGRVWSWIPRARSWRVPFWVIGVAAIPMAIDGFSQLFGFRESTNTLRVLTGLLLGGATAAWAVPILYEALREQRPGPDHV